MERSQASDSVILKTCSFTSLPQPHHCTPLQKTPHPNNEIKKNHKRQLLPRDQSRPLPRHSVLARLSPAPPSGLPVFLLITCLFFKGLLSGRGIAHTLPPTRCIFLLTAALHQERSKEGQEEKEKGSSPKMNSGSLPTEERGSGEEEGTRKPFSPPAGPVLMGLKSRPGLPVPRAQRHLTDILLHFLTLSVVSF